MSVSKVLLAVGIAWLPIFLLSFLGVPHSTDEYYLTFGHDLSIHARFLLALPMLLFLEPNFMRHLSMFTKVTLTIIPEEHKGRIERMFQVTKKYFESPYTLLVLALIVVVILFSLRWTGDYSSVSWAHQENGDITYAGWWYYIVSTTIFMTILLRWLLRWLVWASVLFVIATSPVEVVAEHADGMAGLSFMSFIPTLFGWVLCAVSIVVSSVIAVNIISTGAKLSSFYIDIVIYCLSCAFLVYTPLALLITKVNESYIAAVVKYGALIRKHHLSFEKKWFVSNPEEKILGSPDPSSKADIDGSYAPLINLSVAPVSKSSLITTIIAIILPFVPLLLLKYSLKGLLQNILDLLLG
jgi:hypothetical protein